MLNSGVCLQSASAVWDFCALASEGNRLPEEDIRKTISFCASLLNVFGALTVTLERFSEQLSLFYLHFESVVVQLLQKVIAHSVIVALIWYEIFVCLALCL
ncbi:unnamed protein product [Anisakis simplex]|uniref:Secreted protein n=1 Tax=Anisakis simplex TaxID=6269 RepID=A0A0M3JM48_ANISI|nr:unnamed protein product [Anisakis simplex]